MRLTVTTMTMPTPAGMATAAVVRSPSWRSRSAPTSLGGRGCGVGAARSRRWAVRPMARDRPVAIRPAVFRPGAGAGAAVLEQLLRLERRLALIETAVTSSEFELQRGFSTLERGAGRS